MELIQLYRIEHALLLKHQEEVERRRAAVRAAAVQEASEILLSARQEIRRVLVQTRRELVQLSAQLRAVGYETTLGRSVGGDDFQVSVARDVRNVLRDARSELADLSKDAANLWPAGEEPRLLAPTWRWRRRRSRPPQTTSVPLQLTKRAAALLMTRANRCRRPVQPRSSPRTGGWWQLCSWLSQLSP